MGQINWETLVCSSNQQLGLYCEAALQILQPRQRIKDLETLSVLNRYQDNKKLVSFETHHETTLQNHESVSEVSNKDL